MTESRGGASQQGVREITLKQIQEQKTFVREYCQQFFIPQQNLTDRDDGSQLRQGTDPNIMDLNNNDVSTSRSGIPNTGQNHVAPGSSALERPSAASSGDPQKNEQETTQGMVSAQTPMNAIVPFQGPVDDQDQQLPMTQ